MILQLYLGVFFCLFLRSYTLVDLSPADQELNLMASFFKYDLNL